MSASSLDFPTAEARDLIDSEEWLRTLSDSVPALIWCSGSDGLCTYFNRRWLQFTGRTMQESLGDGWAKDVHPGDMERVVHDYYQALHARRRFRLEYRLRHLGGPYKWIVDFGSPVFGRHNTFLGYIGGCVDVTTMQGNAFAASWREKYDYAIHASLDQLVESICAAEVAIRDRLDDQIADEGEKKHLNESLMKLLELKKKKIPPE